jgi:hypothetical protein
MHKRKRIPYHVKRAREDRKLAALIWIFLMMWMSPLLYIIAMSTP